MIFDVIENAKTLESAEDYINEIKEIPTHLEKGSMGGELKDLLSELTSSYSYVATLVDEANYVINLLNEDIELKVDNCMKTLRKSAANTPNTKKDKLNSIRHLTIGELNICGVTVMGKCTVQGVIEYKLRCEYMRDRFKSILSTIDRSMNVGNTVLSYSKQELMRLHNV